jgi:hypothetical protein
MQSAVELPLAAHEGTTTRTGMASEDSKEGGLCATSRSLLAYACTVPVTYHSLSQRTSDSCDCHSAAPADRFALARFGAVQLKRHVS